MVGNTGTYLDTPYHRFADGYDLAGLALEQAADLPGVVVRLTGAVAGRSTGRRSPPLRSKAAPCSSTPAGTPIRHTDAYFEGHPYLTEAAAAFLRASEGPGWSASILNIDDTADLRRPVHTILLEAEYRSSSTSQSAALPDPRVSAPRPPPKVARMGTFRFGRTH